MKNETLPWIKNRWIPGVLNNKQITILVENKFLEGIGPGSIGEASFDLTINNSGYEILNGTIKPSGGTIIPLLEDKKLFIKLQPEADESFILYAHKSYLFEANEDIRLPSEEIFYGQATPKSSIGRIDVIVRLLMDGATEYDVVRPEDFNRGTKKLFLEISPITFPIRVRRNSRLSQLRLFYGLPEDCKFESELIRKQTISGSTNSDGSLSVDLTPAKISEETVASAFRAKESSSATPIDVDADENSIDPTLYWDPIKWDSNKRLTIEKNHFYILRSKESLHLPKGVAVYCKAMDETLGEMRIHYAGFVHPTFGVKRTIDDKEGTPLIFEVRGHDVNVSLCDGEKLAKLIFYRMSEDYEGVDKEGESGNSAEPSTTSKKKSDPYQNQNLKLSKIFADWSDNTAPVNCQAKLEQGETSVDPFEHVNGQ